MSDTAKIDAYLGALARGLKRLDQKDRDDIVAEIRAHLEHRAKEGRLAEAMKALGAPEHCARTFLDEMEIQDAFSDGGPVKSFGALLALASRRVTAAVGLFASLVFFLLAAGFAFSAFAEIVTPDKAGLWVGDGTFMLGTLDAPPAPPLPGEPAPPHEVLGRWLIPVASALSVFAFIIGQWLSRFFIRLMAKKKTLAV